MKSLLRLSLMFEIQTEIKFQNFITLHSYIVLG